MKNTKIFLQILFGVIFSLSLSDCTAKFTPPPEDMQTDGEIDTDSADINNENQTFYRLITTQPIQKDFNQSETIQLSDKLFGLKVLVKGAYLFVLTTKYLSSEDPPKSLFNMDVYQLGDVNEPLTLFKNESIQIDDASFTPFEESITMEPTSDGIYIFQVGSFGLQDKKNVRVVKFKNDFTWGNSALLFDLVDGIDADIYWIISASCGENYHFMFPEFNEISYGITINKREIENIISNPLIPLYKISWSSRSTNITNKISEMPIDLICAANNLMVSISEIDISNKKSSSYIGVYESSQFQHNSGFKSTFQLCTSPNCSNEPKNILFPTFALDRESKTIFVHWFTNNNDLTIIGNEPDLVGDILWHFGIPLFPGDKINSELTVRLTENESLIPKFREYGMTPFNRNKILIDSFDKHLFLTALSYKNNDNPNTDYSHINILPINYFDYSKGNYSIMVESPPDVIDPNFKQKNSRFFGYDSESSGPFMFFVWYNWQWEIYSSSIQVSGYTIQPAYYDPILP